MTTQSIQSGLLGPPAHLVAIAGRPEGPRLLVAGGDKRKAHCSGRLAVVGLRAGHARERYAQVRTEDATSP